MSPMDMIPMVAAMISFSSLVSDIGLGMPSTHSFLCLSKSVILPTTDPIPLPVQKLELAHSPEFMAQSMEQLSQCGKDGSSFMWRQRRSCEAKVLGLLCEDAMQDMGMVCWRDKTCPEPRHEVAKGGTGHVW
jgi:hypothetical protein